MNILFLHPNFPGQFKHLAKHLAQEGHYVRFLCQTHYNRTLEGVERITLKNKCSHEYLELLNPPISERSQILGDQYRQGFETLKQKGWNPNIIFSHSGWGCGLHAKEIWPKAKLISYLEWWFDPNSSFFSYDANNAELGITPNDIQKNWRRNQQIALELSVSSKIITPTNWQKSQLPKIFQGPCEVIFDGVNTDIFSPSKRCINKNQFKLTYGTRGLEPMRGFPQFIREIPNFLKDYPKAVVEIAGDDRAYYGYQSPSGFKTWGKWAKSYLAANNVINKVKFMGQLNFKDYTKWLLSSNCHVYLTHPFVPSWSLVEAYCSGIPLIVSDIEATAEICGISGGIAYADHRDKHFLSRGFQALVETMKQQPHIKRSTHRFDSRTALAAWRRVSGLNVTTNV